MIALVTLLFQIGILVLLLVQRHYLNRFKKTIVAHMSAMAFWREAPLNELLAGSAPAAVKAVAAATAPTFTCPTCGMRSYHPEDARLGYCGFCHSFTGVPAA